MVKGSAIRPCLALRHLIRNSPVISSLNEALISSTNRLSYSSLVPSQPILDSSISPSPSTACRNQLSRCFISPRNLCTSSTGPSNIVTIKSEEEFNSSLRRVQDESLPAIYYFTAAWCGPCRFISPMIGQLSEKYPHVTTYKVDIDQEGLGSALSKLSIHSVPTFHFFQNGKKASEVIGADINLVKDTYAKLYE